MLRCSSPDEGVDFAWQVKPHSVTVFNTSDQALLLAFVSTTQKNAEFTCTTSRNKETASGVITSKCDGEVIMNLKVQCVRFRWAEYSG